MGGPVLFGIPEWSLGGPPVFMERLARGLLKDGRDTRVLLTETGTNRVTDTITLRERPADIAFDVLPCGSDDSWGERWEALIRYLEERAPCTYVMVHDWRNNVVAARLSDRVRLIGIVQADVELECDQAVRLGRYWDAIVAKSDVIHFGLARRAPQLYPRLVTIRNAAPLPTAAVARISSPNLRIAYCGALRADQKRVHDLIAIAHGLHARGADFELTIMGDGSERDRLEHAAAPLMDLGLVRFTGLVPNAELLEALGAHDAFVLTSEFEGLSNALLEAMSRGCVPVITDIATHAELVQDGVSGYRVPVGDIDAFVDRLSRLADDLPMRRRMSTAAMSTVAQKGYRPADMVAAWLQLLDDVERRAASRQFIRPRDNIEAPPRQVAGIDVLTGNHDHDVSYVNEQPRWPDRHVTPPEQRRLRPRRSHDIWDDAALEDHRVLVSVPFGQISGVDTFSTHLVRGLRRRGIDAAILSEPRPDGSVGLEVAQDLPTEAPGFVDGMGWRHRWRMMAEHLSAQGPCVYLPNYDYDCSGVSAVLPARVKVLPIAHSDDPAHYDHVLRIGAVSNAIVGVSDVIVDHIARLAPTWTERLHTIRYGVDLPPIVRETGDATPLRVVYVGRLVEHQKRVSDVARIASRLAARGVDFELTIIGDGPARAELEHASREMRLDRRIRFLGPLANDQVLRVLGESDAFLLVSAFEGLSVGMLEAMAHQVVPVVSAIRSGTPEVIRDGENGLIAAVGDVDGFAQALTRLACNPQLRRQLAVAARQTIVQQSLQTDDMVARYIEVFRSVTSRPFHRPRAGVIVPPHLREQVSLRRRVRGRAGRSVRRATSPGRRT